MSICEYHKIKFSEINSTMKHDMEMTSICDFTSVKQKGTPITK